MHVEDVLLVIFGLGFLGLAFYCYRIALKYQAENLVMTLCMILSFIAGLCLLAVPLFRQ